MDNPNAIEPITSRPRGKDAREALKLNDNPFGIGPKSRSDVFNEFAREIKEVTANDQQVKVSSLNAFSTRIADRDTNIDELFKAADLTEKLAQNPKIVPENAQGKLVSLPIEISNHRNANLSVSIRAQEVYSKLAEHLPEFSATVQSAYLQNAERINRSPTKDSWKVDLLDKFADHAEKGIHSLQGTAPNDLVRFVGNLSQNLQALPEQDQKTFQSAATKLMVATKFPYKFDAAALREALFVVPEVTRSKKFDDEFKELERNLSTDAAE